MEIRDSIAKDAEAAPQLVLRPLTNADAGEAAELIRAAFAAQNRQTTPPSSALLESGPSIAAKIMPEGRLVLGKHSGRHALKARLELPENERLFERCGFARREVEAHPGFETPTTAVMEKVLE